MSDNELLSRRSLAEDLARTAASKILPHWNDSPVASRTKTSALDLVTDADIDSEVFILGEIKKAFPQDSLVAEETLSSDDMIGYTWAIDPLDGTSNFVQRIGHWCISIGLLYDGVSVAGAIYDPLLDQLFAAAKGHGATCNGSRLERRAVDLSRSTWAIGLSDTLPRSHLYEWNELIRPKVGRTRAMGSLALDLAWTAAGRFDAFYYDCKLRPWDYGAGEVMCREMGLEVLHLQETPGRDAALVALPVEWAAELAPQLKAVHG